MHVSSPGFLRAQSVSHLIEEISGDRPLVGRELFTIDLPQTDQDRQIEIVLKTSGEEVVLSTYFVDGQAATLCIGEDELCGPDPGRLPEGQVITRIRNVSGKVIELPTIHKWHQNPWYPAGNSSPDVLDRVSRKLRDGKPVAAFRELKSLSGKFEEDELQAEWYRLNASILHLFSKIDRVNAPRAQRDLDRALDLAPPTSKVKALSLIDRSRKSRNNSLEDEDADRRRTGLIDAMKDARLAFEVASARGDRSLAAAAMVEVALTSAIRGWLTETQSAVRSARDLDGSLDTLWKTELALASVYRARGETSVAIARARGAVDAVEEIRDLQGNDSEVMFHRRGPAFLLTELLARSGETLAALQSSDLLRVRRPGDEILALTELQELAEEARDSHTIQVLVNTGDHLLNWWTDQGKWKLRVSSHDRGELDSKIERLFSSRGSDIEAARWIADKIFVKDYSQSKRLMLIPLDELRKIPWGVLPVNSRTLIDCASWSMLPNLDAARRELSALPQEDWISIVDPDAPGRVRLSGAREEGQHVSRIIPGSVVLSGASATISALKSNLPGKQMLHIACHGDFDPRDPTASLLHFAPESDHPSGKVFADELAAWDLTAVRLLLLSGCETALAGGLGADDLAGFPGAAFKAGCQGVLGSLWPVEDELTQQMTRQIIDSASARMHPAEALREACRSIRATSETGQVSAWCGWVLVENGR